MSIPCVADVGVGEVPGGSLIHQGNSGSNQTAGAGIRALGPPAGQPVRSATGTTDIREANITLTNIAGDFPFHFALGHVGALIPEFFAARNAELHLDLTAREVHTQRHDRKALLLHPRL